MASWHLPSRSSCSDGRYFNRTASCQSQNSSAAAMPSLVTARSPLALAVIKATRKAISPNRARVSQFFAVHSFFIWKISLGIDALTGRRISGTAFHSSSHSQFFGATPNTKRSYNPVVVDLPNTSANSSGVSAVRPPTILRRGLQIQLPFWLTVLYSSW